MKNILLFCSLALLLAGPVGCGTARPRPQASNQFSEPASGIAPVAIANELKADLLRPANDLFTLGPGDSLEIEILGNPTSRAMAVVGLDGKIYFYLLPGLDVWGLTLAQTRALLEKELAKYVNAPQVSLSLRAVGSKAVWVLGRLNRPGIYPLTGSMTLLESIALAGGTARSASQVTTEELADLRHSFVMRQGQFVPVDFYRLLRDGDTSQNIYLQPDDFVYVPSSLAEEVYVLGAVKFPRAVPYLEQMTLVSAVAGASGPVRYDLLGRDDAGPFMKDAYLSHVAIVRGSLAHGNIAVVDYNAIIKGRSPDVRLEPGDIVYIPNSPYTNLKRYFNTIVNTFVTTVAANEGIRAGGGKVGVGVSVPVGGR